MATLIFFVLGNCLPLHTIMSKAISERVFAVSILCDILQQRGSLAAVLGSSLKSRPDLNAALVQELCYGVCRWYHRLHGTAQILLEKPLRNKDTDIYCLILLGLYQLSFTRIASHAAINETVSDADLLGKPWAKNLINAVLREAQRKQDELLILAEKDYVSWYSHPGWLLSRLKQDWPADYRSIMDANNARAPMTLRVNTSKIQPTTYLELLLQAGIGAQPGLLALSAVILDSPCDVLRLPGFADGLVSVQDEASQLVTTLWPLTSGLNVLDACAAPGGKTCALLEAVPGLFVTAMDNEARRIPRIIENLDRLGLDARVICGDICSAVPLEPASFDRILLDVPCSATGVIRRHPDIKLLRSEAEVKRLTETQAALLQAAWPLLSPGGYLLYSTCSLLKAENSVQIGIFVAQNQDAEPQPLTIPGSKACDFGIQLHPQTGQQDGFYYALLRKRTALR